MTMQTTYSDARARFAELLDRAVDDQETIIVTRKGRPPVAMVDAAELENLREHVHLLTPLANARALLEAIDQADRGEASVVAPQHIAAVREALQRGDQAEAERLLARWEDLARQCDPPRPPATEVAGAAS
ncbi:MAG: type II toxin-antitoxin system Phd/YefM family antitoxin [Chloroflexota bacterium]